MAPRKSDCPKFNQLLPKKDARSPVWQFFGLPADENGTVITSDFSICKLCKHGVLAKAGTTSNLRSHIKIHHPAQYRNLMSRYFLVIFAFSSFK